MKLGVNTLIFLLAFALTGCSYLSKGSFSQNKDKSYLYAKSIPPLKIPPGLSSQAFHNAYPVSDKQYPLSTEDVSIVPPGL